jgi:tRNA (cmo5U34)-methyltransferase
LLTQRGVYVTFENIRPLTNEGITIGKEIWKNFQLSQGRDSTTVEKHLERFDVEYHPITIEEHLSILRKTGFSTVEMLWYSYMQAGFYAIK